jgi:hypothetical protein
MDFFIGSQFTKPVIEPARKPVIKPVVQDIPVSALTS